LSFCDFQTSNLAVTYTDFGKLKTLTEGNKSYELTYGVDDERRQSEYKVNGSVYLTRYYLGDYEEEVTPDGNLRKIHYISGGDGLAAILIRNHGNDTLYYCYTDQLGSLTALTDESGNVVEHYAYDPWGKRRNPENWTQSDSRSGHIVNRGYTMHEHLDAFSIINMNGRVYDPLTAQFFSPDPYIQSSDNWLNYNRYSYCLNNPLKFTDPSGENPLLIAAIIFGAVYGGINLAAHWGQIDNFWDGLAAFGIGFGAGFVGTYLGGTAFVAMGGTAVGGGGFLAGAFSSGIGYTSSTLFGAVGNAIYFGDPLPTSNQVATGLAFSMITGGVMNGVNASANGLNFLTGDLLPSRPTPTRIPTPSTQKASANANVTQPQELNTTLPNQSTNNNFTVTTTEAPQVLSVEGNRLNINPPRPKISGYSPDVLKKTGLSHEFPNSFDQFVVDGGEFSITSKGNYWYIAPGSVNEANGWYSVGTFPNGNVFHRSFSTYYPTAK
jgi:RHS repeat-associated protein